VIFVGFALVASVQAADLRIDCAPGLAVSVDGAAAGVCGDTGQDLVVTAIEEGLREVRIEVPGASPRELKLEMGDVSRQIAVGPIAAAPGAADDAAAEPTGTLEITTDVPRCWVELAGERIQKVEPVLTVLGVPAGKHTLWLQQLGTLIETKIEIPEHDTVRLDVNFADKTAEVLVDASEAPQTAGTEEGLGPGADTSCIHYWLEVLQTSSVPKVGEVSEALEEAGYPIYHQKLITVETGEMPLYKLRLGPFANELSAKQVYFKIKRLGYPGVRVLPRPCPSP
jgi:hypothetical protein